MHKLMKQNKIMKNHALKLYMHCLKKKHITAMSALFFGQQTLIETRHKFRKLELVLQGNKGQDIYFQYLIPNRIRYLCNYKETDNEYYCFI